MRGRIGSRNGSAVSDDTTLNAEEVAALAPRETFYDGEIRKLCASHEALRAALATAEAERDESDAVREMMSPLLTGVANALKGQPPPLTLHDWSDLPAVAATVKASRDSAEAALAHANELMAIWRRGE